ncbi:MAG: tungstate ABC transporter substrate-binding protein WtpA [Anaerolineales bacterium]|nr:tungstate ABC transporter substrate-binding protein WtpA [Anaerolineales bacterium]
MKSKNHLLLLTIIWLDLMTSGCSIGIQDVSTQPSDLTNKTPLVVFAAGSLIIPFAELEQAFEARYPDIDVLAEYHGSIQVMRHVTELHEDIDVVATADASLIPLLMYASSVPESGQPFADWYIRFASNRLALAYTPESRDADEITEENWPDILADPQVKLGLSDPRFDASGYRTLMAFSLMENTQERYNFFGPVFDEQFTFPVTIFRDDDLTTITVPEILETRPDAHIVLRGGSIMLIALLESGDIDYAFEYESVIQQHSLEMLPLPDTVHMGETAYESVYNAVQVNLDFQRFATVKPQFRGERIGYGITIPANAPHAEEAALFVAFLLSPEARTIMEANHHSLFEFPLADGYTAMPESLQALCIPSELP